jgi:hypothetical protein
MPMLVEIIHREANMISLSSSKRSATPPTRAILLSVWLALVRTAGCARDGSRAPEL